MTKKVKHEGNRIKVSDVTAHELQLEIAMSVLQISISDGWLLSKQGRVITSEVVFTYDRSYSRLKLCGNVFPRTLLDETTDKFAEHRARKEIIDAM